MAQRFSINTMISDLALIALISLGHFGQRCADAGRIWHVDATSIHHSLPSNLQTFHVGVNSVAVISTDDCQCESGNQSVSAADAFLVQLEMDTGAATLTLNNEPWFHLLGNLQNVVGWNDNKPLQLEFTSVVNDDMVPEYERFGAYTNVTFVWKESRRDSGDPISDTRVLHTSYLIFQDRQMIIFEQYFPNGWNNSKHLTDRQGDDDKDETLPAIVTGFPIIDLTLPKDDLGYLSWGGCMLSHSHSGDWKDVTPSQYSDLFDADSNGQPWIVHDPKGRTTAWSSLDDFFVSGFAAKTTKPVLDIGLRTTLKSIPNGHRHSSILVAGQGINATVMEWGDILLQNGAVQKERTNIYDDFALAMLGYWTDNGAYHYYGETGPHYQNMEEALVGIKEGMKEKKIPIRYIQWDDWWMEKIGDIPGMLSWTPKKDVFPSGFSDWLGMPLAMYAPEYAAKNVWIEDYSWKVDKETTIPLDPQFYVDLFKNGTSVGMIMFEQDFLCSYGIGGTTLTNSDVLSGKTWLLYMDAAAQGAGIKIQLCMPDGYHILQSTMLPSVTNARGTDDNTRNYPSVLSMGQNTFLFYALGIFTSRDNVWTSNADVNQTGCGNRDFCYEPNAHLDNVVAVLAGGPYGNGDALEFVNRTVVMYSCRTDGLLLRPQWPLASLEFAFTDDDAKGSLIWAAHDDFESLRWSYVVGVGLTKDVAITPRRLSPGTPCTCGEMVVWEVVIGEKVRKVVLFSNSSPFMFPKSKPLNLPYEINSPAHTHYNTAPVLPNGMVFLGETNKWATMSFGRVLKLNVGKSSLLLVVAGAPSETVTFAYMNDTENADEIEEITCTFASSCSFVDQHGNKYCQNMLTCSRSGGCACGGNLRGEVQLRGL